MQRTGTADLPLHGGSAPRWLWRRMVDLSGAIVDAIVLEQGPDEVVRRVSDPHWFQAFSCVIGFDWHSSGTTTTGTGALREAVDPARHGLAVAGGKGRTSRRTGAHIEAAAGPLGLCDAKVEELGRASRLAAKVDNACVQDGYQLYHHAMFVSETGRWSVVQQGMGGGSARRYHWLSEGLRGFVDEPHAGIACDRETERALDMTARISERARDASLDLVRDGPDHLRGLLRGHQPSLEDFGPGAMPAPHLVMPRHHDVRAADISERGWEVLRQAYELQPSSYEEMLLVRGMGPQKVRALALVSEVAFGAPLSWRDPVRFSYAHGGKDGTPFPVDRGAYESSIGALRQAVEAARMGDRERMDALRRLPLGRP
jgi:hypothetical protein